MEGLKKRWRLVILHSIVLSIAVYTLTQGTPGLFEDEGFDPGLSSGKWAVRFLLLCLTVTPLNTYLRWRWAIPLRKWLGLWAFAFSVLHLAVFLYTYATKDLYTGVIGYGSWQFWRSLLLQFYVVLGVLGMLILSALALTSNRMAMRRLKQNWKRLHRLVYGAGVLVVVHAMLATTRSKRMFRDPDAIGDLRVYLVVLTLLLVLRIPAVRQVIDQPARWLRRALAGEVASN